MALSSLAVAYFFIPPIHSFSVRREFLPIFIEFGASSAIVSWFGSWRREAEAALKRARNDLQTRVEERTAELKQANQQLLAEIAERKRAEEAYYEAQAELGRVSRMSAMGALAASIAHEVNQPLAAVVTNPDACAIWLSSEPPNIEEARVAVGCIAREGTRASDIIRRIRALFTKSSQERAPVQLNDLIREVETFVQAEAARNQVTFSFDLAKNLPATLADRVQLQQVIVNLVLNGIDAMRSVMDRPRRIVIRSEAKTNGEILVAVSDSGIGIAAADQKRIFDAFFTTKAQGMGMGLSVSRSIVEAHGGRLWAESNPDHGATFRFTLPTGRGSEA